AADGPEDLDEPVVQPEEDVAHALGIEGALGIAGDDGVLVLELVLQHVLDGGPERRVAIPGPDQEGLAHSVDLDRRQHGGDGGCPEEAAEPDEDGELQPPAEVEGGEAETEELLPEREVTRLHGNELVEHALQMPRSHAAERLVEGKVEELVEDQPAP